MSRYKLYKQAVITYSFTFLTAFKPELVNSNYTGLNKRTSNDTINYELSTKNSVSTGHTYSDGRNSR